MKKVVLITMILWMAGFVHGVDFTLNLSISHSLESGRFFEPFSAVFPTEDGFLNRDYRNRTGVGLDLSLQVRVIPKLLLIPGIGVVYGHQEAVETANAVEGESVTRTEYFRVFSAYVDAAYRVLSLKNNWHFDLLAGVGRSRINSEEMLLLVEEGKSFWNLRAGAAFSFRELRHWGVRFQVMYHLPVKQDYPRYFSLQGGVLYRF